MNIPEGYRQNSKGDLVALSNIKPLDQLRDDLVLKMVEEAISVSTEVAKFKKRAFSDFDTFLHIAAEEHGMQLRDDWKGNMTLYSFDGQFKVQIAVQEFIAFDEQLQLAKQLIDSCITRWSDGANVNLRVLINDAFKVDKQGNISTGKVLGLRRHNISDPDWKKAMHLISESVTVVDSKRYVRIYVRSGDSGEYRPISLDAAGA